MSDLTVSEWRQSRQSPNHEVRTFKDKYGRTQRFERREKAGSPEPKQKATTKKAAPPARKTPAKKSAAKKTTTAKPAAKKSTQKRTKTGQFKAKSRTSKIVENARARLTGPKSTLNRMIRGGAGRKALGVAAIGAASYIANKMSSTPESKGNVNAARPDRAAPAKRKAASKPASTTKTTKRSTTTSTPKKRATAAPKRASGGVNARRPDRVRVSSAQTRATSSRKSAPKRNPRWLAESTGWARK